MDYFSDAGILPFHGNLFYFTRRKSILLWNDGKNIFKVQEKEIKKGALKLRAPFFISF